MRREGVASNLSESDTLGWGSKLNMPSGVSSDTRLPEPLEGDILGFFTFGFSVWGEEIGGLEMEEGRVDGGHSKIVMYPSFCESDIGGSEVFGTICGMMIFVDSGCEMRMFWDGYGDGCVGKTLS